jgi:hypothetical protein
MVYSTAEFRKICAHFEPERPFTHYACRVVLDPQAFTNEVAEFLVNFYNIPKDNLPKDENGNICIKYLAAEEYIQRSKENRANGLLSKSIDDEFINMIAHRSCFDPITESINISIPDKNDPIPYAHEISHALHYYVKNFSPRDMLHSSIAIEEFYAQLGQEAISSILDLQKENLHHIADLIGPTRLFKNTDVKKLRNRKSSLAIQRTWINTYTEQKEIEAQLNSVEDSLFIHKSAIGHLVGSLAGKICYKLAKQDKNLYTRSDNELKQLYINKAKQAWESALEPLEELLNLKIDRTAPTVFHLPENLKKAIIVLESILNQAQENLLEDASN